MVLRRPLVFGEVLFDRFPDGRRVLGGAPFTVAWNLQALGLAPLFVSRVGDDALGEEVRGAMEGWGMDLAGVQVDGERGTGVVDVRFIGGEPEYEIVPDRAFDFIDAGGLPELGGEWILYRGTLGVRNGVSAGALGEIYRRLGAEGVKPDVFVDVNLRSPWWNLAGVREAISGARWVKVSEEELLQIVPDGGELEDLVGRLMEEFELEAVVVTRGARGAIAVAAEGGRWEVVPEGGVKVVDTVGAGDAFSSALMLGIVRGWPLGVAMERAQEFAGGIVGIKGATMGDRGFYEGFYGRWG